MGKNKFKFEQKVPSFQGETNLEQQGENLKSLLKECSKCLLPVINRSCEIDLEKRDDASGKDKHEAKKRMEMMEYLSTQEQEQEKLEKSLTALLNKLFLGEKGNFSAVRTALSDREKISLILIDKGKNKGNIFGLKVELGKSEDLPADFMDKNVKEINQSNEFNLKYGIEYSKGQITPARRETKIPVFYLKLDDGALEKIVKSLSAGWANLTEEERKKGDFWKKQSEEEKDVFSEIIFRIYKQAKFIEESPEYDNNIKNQAKSLRGALERDFQEFIGDENNKNWENKKG